MFEVLICKNECVTFTRAVLSDWLVCSPAISTNGFLPKVSTDLLLLNVFHYSHPSAEQIAAAYPRSPSQSWLVSYFSSFHPVKRSTGLLWLAPALWRWVRGPKNCVSFPILCNWLAAQSYDTVGLQIAMDLVVPEDHNSTLYSNLPHFFLRFWNNAWKCLLYLQHFSVEADHGCSWIQKIKNQHLHL